MLTQINKAFKPNGTLDTRTDTLSRYRSDGQIIYQTSTNMVTNDIQRTYYNDAGMIDAMGNQRSYRVQVTKASGTGSYTNNYTTNYVRFDGYKASTIAVTTTQTGFTPGTTTNAYSERGELMQAAATGTAGFTRQYASNREGMVTSRRETSGKIQNYVYYQGGVVASVGNAAVAELSSTLTPIWQNEFEASRPDVPPPAFEYRLALESNLIAEEIFLQMFYRALVINMNSVHL